MNTRLYTLYFLWKNAKIVILKLEENMFKVHSDYQPTGDQPKAIEYLSKGIQEGKKFQTLLGVTGSRKNFYHGKYYPKGAKANLSFST